MRSTRVGVVAAVVLAGALLACGGPARRQPPPSSSRPAQTTPGTAAMPDASTWLALGGGARVRVPLDWQRIRYHGEPATVASPIVFLTDGRLDGPCVTGPPSSACTGQAWFAPRWTTPGDGVLLVWVGVSMPGPATDHPFLPYIHADTITLAHRPAKIARGPAGACPPGAGTEIDAYVQRSPTGYPGDRLDMTACLGVHSPPGTRHEVMRMLHSLRFAAHGP